MKLFLAMLLSLLVAYLGYANNLGFESQSHNNVTHVQHQTHRDHIRGIINSHRAIRVFSGNGIDARHTQLIQAVLGRFKLFPGIHVQLVEDRTTADVVIFNWNNRINNCFIGFQPTDTDVVLLDIDKITEDLAFQIVFLHELGHWFGMRHVCRVRGERSECSPVGYGEAVLNPAIGYDTGYSEQFTQLDLNEFHRVVD